ncbi:hypothetical protein EXM22_08025 [Oceanispirochaeta crateris]|uniref:DUF5723 domain-containing protein n=1 Tax=Oceanispirochaeta crateris TaxID=2518645 RepID=A0A5C1QP24_9SPIO|nr:hypothetical protein [Oceanispirochaeta crateris]QEN07932.1 hypothetical protein EXM22_08025 [Oceanispirochaeta crateris]
MKKIILTIQLILMTSGILFAKDRYYSPAFTWNSPEIQGQGGSFIANGSGYSSLLVNPASFEKSGEKINKEGEIVQKGEVTLLSLGSAYAGDAFSFMSESRTTDKGVLELILDQVTSGGLGGSFQAGGAYVGRRFGVGLMTIAELDAPAVETTLGVTADLIWTTGLVAGYAYPFELGQVKLVVGSDLRPMYRFTAKDINIDALTSSASSDSDGDISFSDVTALGGVGVAFDLGADLYWRDLIASVTMRDIGNTRYFYEPVSSALGMEFSDEEVDDIYITPWTLNFGVSYNPIMGQLNKYLDMTVHGSFTQPLIREDSLYGYKTQSFWTRLDLGTEVVLLSSVALRAGVQGGYFTAGFGLDLFFVEISGALYAEETGSHAGDQPKLGGSMELAIRY